MEITRVGRSQNILRTCLPARIHRALDIRAGDYLVWSYNPNGHIVVRRAPRPDELAAHPATVKRLPRTRKSRNAT